MNNFSNVDHPNHIKLSQALLRHMFLTINIKTIKLNECRRLVLFHYDKAKDIIEMRHYAIKAKPIGVSSRIRKIVQGSSSSSKVNALPDLSKYNDISEYLVDQETNQALQDNNDSEIEEEEAHRVTLAEDYVGKGNKKSQLSAMKLVEIGPRLSLELYKVEQEVCEGDILYHKFNEKDPLQAAASRAKVLLLLLL